MQTTQHRKQQPLRPHPKPAPPTRIHPRLPRNPNPRPPSADRRASRVSNPSSNPIRSAKVRRKISRRNGARSPRTRARTDAAAPEFSSAAALRRPSDWDSVGRSAPADSPPAIVGGFRTVSSARLHPSRIFNIGMKIPTTLLVLPLQRRYAWQDAPASFVLFPEMLPDCAGRGSDAGASGHRRRRWSGSASKRGISRIH